MKISVYIKVTFPDMWTNSCCSHPLATPAEMDETAARGVRLAAQRRAAIELGLPEDECRPEQICYLTRILYAAGSAATGGGQWGEHELDYILFHRGGEEVKLSPNREEVAAVEWVGRAQLPEFVAAVRGAGGQFTPWFELISKVNLYCYKTVRYCPQVSMRVYRIFSAWFVAGHASRLALVISLRENSSRTV